MGRWSPEVGGDGASEHSLFEVYDDYLVPLVFQAYAEDVADRLAGLSDAAVLETAAGTGAVTRVLAARLPESVAITATDLVPGMLEWAEAVGTVRPVRWEVANALELPYEDGAFDVVVCAFGDSPVDRWRPWGVRHIVLQAPAGKVEDIRVEEAVDAVSGLLRV